MLGRQLHGPVNIRVHADDQAVPVQGARALAADQAAADNADVHSVSPARSAGTKRGSGEVAPPPEMAMILPDDCRRMMGTTARQQRTVPNRLISVALIHSLQSTSSVNPIGP